MENKKSINVQDDEENFLKQSKEKFEDSLTRLLLAFEPLLSMVNFRNNERFLQSVVIKGFMDEPAKLYSVKNNKKVTTVLCRDGKSEMNFKNDMVFQYNEELYQKLREAFESNDTEGLAREWLRAKPVMSPESAG
jgi:hypothetical protein